MAKKPDRREHTRYFMEQLKDEKIPFNVCFTGSQTKLICRYGKFKQSDFAFHPDELGLLNRVRAYVKNNVNHYPKGNIDVNYIDFGIFPSVVTDVVEFDLNKAYWTFAYHRGYISKEIYEIGLQATKRARLAAIGALAKVSDYWRFNGYTYKFLKRETSPTANIFFDCCKATSDVMQAIKKELGQDYLFFWVDAVFFQDKKSNLPKVIEIAKSFSLEGKTKEIDIVHNTQDRITCIDSGKKRIFFKPLKQ